MQSPAGVACVQEFHRGLFTNASALRRKIKSITGMDVSDATAEIEPTTGGVVQVFTTDTNGESFCGRSLAHRPQAERPDAVSPASTKAATSAKPTKPLDVNPGMIA